MRMKKCRYKRCFALFLILILSLGTLDLSVFAAAGTETEISESGGDIQPEGDPSAGNIKEAESDPSAGNTEEAESDPSAGNIKEAESDPLADKPEETEGDPLADEPDGMPEAEEILPMVQPEEDTYTVIYKDDEEVFAEYTGLKEGTWTPGYQDSWFQEKEKDFKTWSPSWKSIVGGENHTITYTARYKSGKEKYPFNIYYRWAVEGKRVQDLNEEKYKAAPVYEAELGRGDDYFVESPQADPAVNFRYSIDRKVINGRVGYATSRVENWVSYTPIVEIHHIYRENGTVIAEMTDTTTKRLAFGGTLRAGGVTKITNYNGKTYQYADADEVTLPEDPAQLTEQPVLKLYYDLETPKTSTLTVYYRWAGADPGKAQAAETYTRQYKEGEAYEFPIPEADVPFAYTTDYELGWISNKGVMGNRDYAYYVFYYPLFKINHIYQRDGETVGYALWDADTVSWYDAEVYKANGHIFGNFNETFNLGYLFRYPWVFWPGGTDYETFTFDHEDSITFPGDPNELKETPVINMYYNKTTYVDISVRYLYEAQDGSETELLDDYKVTLAKKSGYDVSEQIPETITKDEQTYKKDSVDGELAGTALENKTIIVKYVAETGETPENPDDTPTEPTTPPGGGGGGGGGRTPDPTPEPPTPEPPVPTPAIPIITPVIPTPAAVTPAPVNEAAAPEAENAVVMEEEVPLAGKSKPAKEEPVKLEDEEIPLAAGEDGSWALLNFALMNLAVFESIMLLVGYFVKTKNDKEEERKLKKKGLFRLASLPIAVVSLIVFIVTENIHLQTVMVDKYTIIMLLVAVLQTVMVVLSNKKYEEEQEI